MHQLDAISSSSPPWVSLPRGTKPWRALERSFARTVSRRALDYTILTHTSAMQWRKEHCQLIVSSVAQSGMALRTGNSGLTRQTTLISRIFENILGCFFQGLNRTKQRIWDSPKAIFFILWSLVYWDLGEELLDASSCQDKLGSQMWCVPWIVERYLGD